MESFNSRLSKRKQSLYSKTSHPIVSSQRRKKNSEWKAVKKFCKIYGTTSSKPIYTSWKYHKEKVKRKQQKIIDIPHCTPHVLWRFRLTTHCWDLTPVLFGLFLYSSIHFYRVSMSFCTEYLICADCTVQESTIVF